MALRNDSLMLWQGLHGTRPAGAASAAIGEVEEVTLSEFRFRTAGCDKVLYDTEVFCNETEGGTLLTVGSPGAGFVHSGG